MVTNARLAPPWEKNAQLIPTGRDENGLPTYINFSYTNPYAMLGSAVRGALNKVEEGQKLGKTGEQIAFEATAESMSELFSPFLQESIMGARILDVMPREVIGGRGGQTVTGARVYNPVESTGDKIAKGFAHIVGGLIPSGVPVELSGRGLEAGRFARSFMEATGINDLTGASPLDRQGRERQFSGELVRAFTGVTENTIDPKLGLKYKGFEFARDRQSASNIFNRVARTLNLNDPEALLEAWQDANEARYRVTNQFSQALQDLETMGMNKGQIRKILKDAGIGGVDAVLQGRYEPLQISDPVREDMMRNGTINFLPQNEIMGLQFYNMTRGFGKQDFEPTVRLEEAPAEQQPTAPAPVPAPTAPPVAPAQPLSQSSNATSPILNPDPTTRALAEELERMDRERLAAQLRLHEGVEHKPYKCTAGYLTIGVGRNIEERGLSDDEIDYILNNDVDIATSELASTFDWFAGLDDVRMRVVVDMVFNLGMPRFKQFQNMLAAIEAQDWPEAAAQMMDSRWAKQVGARAERLRDMMETGEDSSDF
jgi:lysozyme